jgi:DNA-binding IclR family transcriptional regulator
MIPPGLRLSLSILQFLAQDGGCASFSRLRRGLGQPTPAALSRQLHALTAAGWVEGGAGQPWRCGRAYRTAAQRLGEAPDLGTRVAGVVEALAERTGESAAVVDWQGDGFVFRAKSERPDSYHYLEVGEKNSGATNHAFASICLAYASDEDRAAWTPRCGRDLEAEGRKLRAQGWHAGTDRGYRVAAPILGAHQQLIAVIGISMLPRSISAAEQARLVRAVRKHAALASARLS